MTLEWIWAILVFLFGCCIGSFLNVVVYRLPRDKSLVRPPSSCPACGRAIRFYDNVPLLSWLILRGRCRSCGAPISVRYFVIELVTGLLWLGLYIVLFVYPVRSLGLEGTGPLGRFLAGGWLLWLAYGVLLTGLLAASAIDLELWIIPLSLCWTITLVGILSATGAGWVIDMTIVRGHRLFPTASAAFGAVTAGGLLGLAVAVILLETGRIRRSYADVEAALEEADGADLERLYSGEEDTQYDHRRESLKEICFLLPVILGAVAGGLMYHRWDAFARAWIGFSQTPAVAGFLGGAGGYLVGCGVVWGTRILGTLAFGKEAMGLGDVHLMGAAGAFLGPLMIVVAFFAAPFFGLAWAAVQMISRKTRQIPYGPFLSLGILTVMILHDRLWVYLSSLYIG